MDVLRVKGTATIMNLLLAELMALGDNYYVFKRHVSIKI